MQGRSVVMLSGNTRVGQLTGVNDYFFFENHVGSCFATHWLRPVFCKGQETLFYIAQYESRLGGHFA